MRFVLTAPQFARFHRMTSDIKLAENVRKKNRIKSEMNWAAKPMKSEESALIEHTKKRKIVVTFDRKIQSLNIKRN